MKTKKGKTTLYSIVVVLFLLIVFFWRKVFPKRKADDETTMLDDIQNSITILNPFMSARKTAESIVKKYEGLRLSAYLDSAGIPTIGYGIIRYSNGQPVKIGDVITREKAEAEFKYHFDKFFSDVSSRLKTSVTDNQLASLVSFSYNVGINALLNSTLWRKLHNGSPVKEVADEFRKWVNAGGKKVQGLVNRRESERNLFLT